MSCTVAGKHSCERDLREVKNGPMGLPKRIVRIKNEKRDRFRCQVCSYTTGVPSRSIHAEAFDFFVYRWKTLTGIPGSLKSSLRAAPMNLMSVSGTSSAPFVNAMKVGGRAFA